MFQLPNAAEKGNFYQLWSVQFKMLQKAYFKYRQCRIFKGCWGKVLHSFVYCVFFFCNVLHQQTLKELQTELELIIDYKGTSWVALGWRPLGINKSCRLFPDLENIKWKRDVENKTSFNKTESVKESDNDKIEPFDLKPVQKAEEPKNNGFCKTFLHFSE